MPNLTPNYKLKKPIKATENADIDVLNENMDTMDTELKKVSDKANKREVIVKNIIIPITPWSSTIAGYQVGIKDSDVATNDVVDINISGRDIYDGKASNFTGATLSGNGEFFVYFWEEPTETVNATIVIQKGAI